MSEQKEEMPAWVVFLMIGVLIAGPIVVGGQIEATIGEPTELSSVMKAVGYSVLVGVFMAFLGYAKSVDPKTGVAEPFSPEHFVITPLVGVFVGITMGMYGLSYTAALEWLASIGVLALIEFLGKAIVRRFWR